MIIIMVINAVVAGIYYITTGTREVSPGGDGVGGRGGKCGAGGKCAVGGAGRNGRGVRAS